MKIDNLWLRYVCNENKFFLLSQKLKQQFPELRLIFGRKSNVYSNTLVIRHKEVGTSIFIGYGNIFRRTQKNNLFLKFNPTKVSKYLRNVIIFIHNILKGKWYIHSLDIAFDIEADLNDIAIWTRKRKITKFHTTTYFGVRNGHGNIKVYDKNSELLFNGKNVKKDKLTRIEYTHKEVGNLVTLKELEVTVDFYKNNDFFYVNNIETQEKEFFENNICKSRNQIGSKQRVMLDVLKDQSRLQLLCSNLQIKVFIAFFLKETNLVVSILSPKRSHHFLKLYITESSCLNFKILPNIWPVYILSQIATPLLL